MNTDAKTLNKILANLTLGTSGWLGWLSDWLLISAQVIISGLVKLNADSTEPAWDSLSPSLCPSPMSALSLAQINEYMNKWMNAWMNEWMNKCNLV